VIDYFFNRDEHELILSGIGLLYVIDDRNLNIS